MDTITKRTTTTSSKTPAPGAKPKAVVKRTRRTASPRKTRAEKQAMQADREDHFNRIQKEAYLLAERDGFAGDPTSYWLAAEARVKKEEGTACSAT